MSLIDLLLEHKHEYLAGNTIGKIIHEYFAGENTDYESDEYLHVKISKIPIICGYNSDFYILGYIHNNNNVMGIINYFGLTNGDYRYIIGSYYYSQDYIEHMFDNANIKNFVAIWELKSSLISYRNELTLNDILPKHTKSDRSFI